MFLVRKACRGLTACQGLAFLVREEGAECLSNGNDRDLDCIFPRSNPPLCPIGLKTRCKTQPCYEHRGRCSATEARLPQTLVLSTLPYVPRAATKTGTLMEAVQGACLAVVAQHGGVVLKLSGNVAVTLLRAARS
jgi:hypothetical protein